MFEFQLGFLGERSSHPVARSAQSGFTLIELMVSIAIVVLVTGIVLFKYGTLNSVVLLKSQAYATALDIRQTQVAGTGVEGQNSSYRNDEYGIQFNLSTPNTYTFFQNSPSTVLSTFAIDPRFKLTKLCTDGTSCSASVVTICFMRPDFTARISTTSSCPSSAGAASAQITLAVANSTAMTRTIEVTQTGQISVQ